MDVEDKHPGSDFDAGFCAERIVDRCSALKRLRKDRDEIVEAIAIGLIQDRGRRLYHQALELGAKYFITDQGEK